MTSGKMKKSQAIQVTPQELLDTLHKFNMGFRYVRAYIEEMSDEQLIELYEKAKELNNISWLLRCMVLGVANHRAGHGDKTKIVESIAKTFGIMPRMAYLDIQVYETFIKDNPDFEPLLPPMFYQIAASMPHPNRAIEIALEKKAEMPTFPASAFKALLKGEVRRERIPKGAYMMVPIDTPLSVVIAENRLDEEGITPLYGGIKVLSIGGNLYAEVK